MTERKGEEVSIVVPVFNAAAYIEKTAEMVRRQTWPHWQLILVDDHSSDDSFSKMEALAAKDERILLIEQEEGKKGAAAARNLGISKARGRYLAFLDADDIWMEDKLERQLAFLRQKQAAFTFTGYEFGDEDANPTGKIVKVPETLNFKQALSRTVIFTTTVLFDRDKIDNKLLYMPQIKSEDTATWWNILKAGYTAYGLDENLAVYRRPKKSLSSNKVEALRRIWNLYRQIAGLSVLSSAWYFIFWAVRATLRRI